MEGSSEEALIPKKRSSLGVPFAIVALLVVVGLIFRASRKRRKGDAITFDAAVPPAELPPNDPPAPLLTANPAGEHDSHEHHEHEHHHQHEQHEHVAAPSAEAVSANGSYGESVEHG